MELKPLLRLFGIGMVMGAAEVVPGVSGGSIAFITGIYERLLNAIKQFTPMLLLRLKNDGISATWKAVDANFLLILFGGMAVSVVLLASGLKYMLEHEAVFIWSFFFGLVLLSVYLVLRQISRFGLGIGAAIGVGIALGYIVTSAVPLNLAPTPLNLFCGGIVAISAWVLPGISGSFILLILGLYRFVIDAIADFNILLLTSFAAGCGIGIVVFSQLLSRLLSHYRNETLAVLTGIMLGSLGKIWPWRHVSSYQLKPDGSQTPIVEEPVSPWVYTDMVGANPEIGLAAVGFLLGAVAVLGLHLLSKESAV
ncbi:MAG: putative membrane protein [Patiriisocius sp.]|jgi:putative membrane protein